MPYFGRSPRGALEVSLPFWLLPDGLGLGVGGAGGAEFHVLEWFGVWAQLGGQHLFLYPYLDPPRLTASAGVRLRLP